MRTGDDDQGHVLHSRSKCVFRTTETRFAESAWGRLGNDILTSCCPVTDQSSPVVPLVPCGFARIRGISRRIIQ